MKRTLLIGLAVTFCLCVAVTGCKKDAPADVDAPAEITKVIEIVE